MQQYAFCGFRQEHSTREKALKMPPRLIRRVIEIDRSRYTGERLRAIRAECGLDARAALRRFADSLGALAKAA
jgi:hypothetical protein